MCDVISAYFVAVCVLQIGAGFLSVGYAMVQKDGKITKVSLSRIYDVKEAL